MEGVARKLQKIPILDALEAPKTKGSFLDIYYSVWNLNWRLYQSKVLIHRLFYLSSLYIFEIEI